jgi:hypothetical protein
MIIDKIAQRTGKYTLLLISLLIALIMYPLIEDHDLGRTCLMAWSIVTMLTVIISLHDNKQTSKSVMIGSGVLCCLIGVLLTRQILKLDHIFLYHIILPISTIFCAFIIWTILSSIFRRNKLGPDELAGSIVCYLLMGIMWGIIYSYIELIAPFSFSFGHAETIRAKGSALFYFSFVTLTTVGYGDILPVSRGARMAAYLEAVAGVMYTAILVAGLVGHVSKRSRF